MKPMKPTKPLLTAFAALALLAMAGAQATNVSPTSYDMPNGYGQNHGGSFNYWDRAYSGSGNTQLDYDPLSGGLGDLADGVVATASWDSVENVEGTGPYVGWSERDPVITFHFAGTLQFTQLTVWHDDANGYGNVATPRAFVVTVGDQSQTFTIADPLGDLPFASTLQLAPGMQGSSLQLQVLRQDTAVMLSEVSFQAVAVPEPSTWALWLVGSAVMLHARRRGDAA